MTEKLSEDNPDHKDTGRRNPPKEDKGGRTAAIPSISDILAEDRIEVKGITDRPAPKKKRQSTGAPTGNQPQRRTRRSPAPPRPNRDEQGGLQTLRKFQEFEKLDPKNADFLGSIITPKEYKQIKGFVVKKLKGDRNEEEIGVLGALAKIAGRAWSKLFPKGRNGPNMSEDGKNALPEPRETDPVLKMLKEKGIQVTLPAKSNP